MSPIISTFTLFHRLADQRWILCRIYHCLVPVVKLGHLWHDIEPRLPERIISFLGFVQKKQKKSICGTLFTFVFIEPIFVLKDYLAKLWMSSDFFKGNETLKGHIDKSLSMLDWLISLYSNKPVPENSWVFLPWILYAIFVAPISKHYVFVLFHILAARFDHFYFKFNLKFSVFAVFARLLRQRMFVIYGS